MTRVLFLDIDGVLNSRLFFKQGERGQTTAEERACIKKILPHVDLPPGIKNRMAVRLDLRQLDRQAIAWLNKAATLPGVQVVVSSTWRHGYKIQGLQLLLESRGFKGQIIGRTPDLWGRSVRGDEIQQWLDEYQTGVESVAILDDDSDMGHLLPRLVQTDNKVGLQPADVERVIEMLMTG